MAETQASLKAQIPGICRLYCSQVWKEALKRAGVDASSDLWKVESIFYPPAIRKTASSSSEAMRDPQEAGAVQTATAQIIVSSGESTEGGESLDATEAPGGLNPKMPKEGADPTVNAQIPDAEEPAILAQPLQAISLAEVPKSTDTDPAQLSPEGTLLQGAEVNPILSSQDVADTKLKK